jgi:hypothetical protein
MSVTLTHVVAALASVTVVLSSAIPEVGGSDVAVSGRFSLPPPPATHADEAAGFDITAGSEFAHFGLSSAGTEVYHDDEFVGAPEEIYAKVNARLASLGLEKRGELVAKNKVILRFSTYPFLSPLNETERPLLLSPFSTSSAPSVPSEARPSKKQADTNMTDLPTTLRSHRRLGLESCPGL